MTNNDQKMPSRNVVVWAYDGVQLIDVAGPVQAMTTANEDSGRSLYDIVMVAERAGGVRSASGLTLYAGAVGESPQRIDTLLIPGGPGVHTVRRDPQSLRLLHDLTLRAERICAVCTGAFLLAEMGLLDGRRAVTHWRSCDRLAREFPAITVDPQPLFLQDGPIWTTAGVTAGIDLMLDLIRQDHGDSLAASVARRLVVYMRRPGGQKQYSEPLALQTLDAAPYAGLIGDITACPEQPWPVERMAEHAGQSVRTFHRRFEAATGFSPAQAVERIRGELARSLLHTTGLSLGQIAGRTGFGSELRLRRAMLRQYGVTPSDLRERFS